MKASGLSFLLLTCMTLAAPAQAQRHTERGALLGGLSGALIGAAVGENNGEAAEGALIGSAIGLFSGAAIGNSYDQEEMRRQASLRHQQIARNSAAVSLTDVVQMSHNGLSDAVIINQIRQRGVQQRLQVSEVIFLHNQGVGELVITAMQQAPIAGASSIGRVEPAHPVIVERHHYLTPRTYWHPPHHSPRYHYYRGHHHHQHRPGVRFGISLGH